jgi:hypothetical protein
LRELLSKRGGLKDDVVDEHFLLLFLQYLGERPKFNREEAIAGTKIGAVSRDWSHFR